MPESVSWALFFATSISNRKPGLCKGTLDRDGEYEKTVVFPHDPLECPLISSTDLDV
jgi:hypothetical protein